MSKVDMSRYVECPVCHTYQIILNPCQKCMSRRLATEGELPASGIVPYDPFKALNAQKLKEIKKTTKPKESEDDKKPTKPKESEDDKKRMKATAKMGNEAERMPKVDMSRYLECPICHTWQITLNPCQKCLTRRMAAEGRLPASGIVPYDPFKVYSLKQKAKEKPPKKPKETPEELSEHMRQIATRRNDHRRDNALMKRAPPLVDALKDGESHYLADLARNHVIPFGVTVTDWCVTRTMIQMGLIEWFKTGPSHNSPVKIWIPALKIQDAIEYAEALKNGKD